MKVYAHNDPIRQRVVVYVEVSVEEDGGRWFRAGKVNALQSGDTELVLVAPGAEPPMYLSIPYEVAEAVGEALAPRPAVTERHLDDAIVVRDRLLRVMEMDSEAARHPQIRVES